MNERLAISDADRASSRLSGPERQLLRKWNGTDSAVCAEDRVHALFSRIARRRPERDEAGNPARYGEDPERPGTWRELEEPRA